jgi:GNAT superfamily N-acetyltransferase
MLSDNIPQVICPYTFKLASKEDIEAIAELHQEIRLVTDRDHLPEYTQAAAAEGYFNKYWSRCLGRENCDESTIMVISINEAIAFVRFGVIDKPVKAIGVVEEAKWGELHQIYILPKHQGQGLGKHLFEQAAKSLFSWGCDHMLINVLEGNQRARIFYEHRGAHHLTSIIEQNTRNGNMYDVPCALYVYDLK